MIWEVVYKVGVEGLSLWKVSAFPSPITVGKTLIDLISDGTLSVAITASIRRIAIGYFISILIGTFIIVLMLKFKYLEENLKSLMLGLQSLPNVCWIPFAILWFGLNESTIIFVIALSSTIAIVLTVGSGISNVNPLLIRAAKTMGANGLKIYTNVIIPASFPSIISGLKQGWSFAWRGLITGEVLVATKGLGQVLYKGRDSADISQIIAVMLVIILLGLTVDKFILGKIEDNIRYKWGLNRS